jgi:hypothetical protein
MYVPREGSRREQLIEIVNKSGGITAERLIENYEILEFSNAWNITRELKKLVNFGCIKQIGDVFFPVFKVKPVNEDNEINLVPPREPVPFKPLQTFPPKISPRGQVIERRSFKTCKSNVRYQGKNEL